MKLVRIICDSSSEAADLISFLEYQGFAVEIGEPSDPNAPPADFELDMRVLPTEASLHLAREMASEGVDVFIAPGVLGDAPSSQPEELLAVEFESTAQEAEEPTIGETPSSQVPEPAIVGFESREESAQDTLTQELPRRVADPIRVIAWTRLRESLAQAVTEAALTGRECVAFCSAEILNGSEHARQWLAQVRMMLVRKRALVETRAIRARAAVESRLRFDSSQNAWIRSAFAGAGLMVVLIALMLWNDERLVTPRTAARGVSAASAVKASPMLPSVATPVPVSAALHRQVPSGRTAITDDQEVIIRHYDRRVPKTTAAIDRKSGIKHISDMD